MIDAPEALALEAEDLAAPLPPRTAAEMATYYERMVRCERKIEHLDTYEKERIEQIKVACAKDRAKIEAERDMWATSILAFLDQLGEERVRLPDLGVSLGAAKESGLRWVDEAALLEWAKVRNLLNPAKPPAPTPDKRAIQEYYTKHGTVPTGAEVKTGTVLSVAKLRGSR